MSLRDQVRDWIKNGYVPAPNHLCSKRLAIKNLNQIKQLLEEDSPYIAKERIMFLIDDIENDKLKPGNL